MKKKRRDEEETESKGPKVDGAQVLSAIQKFEEEVGGKYAAKKIWRMIKEAASTDSLSFHDTRTLMQACLRLSRQVEIGLEGACDAYVAVETHVSKYEHALALGMN